MKVLVSSKKPGRMLVLRWRELGVRLQHSVAHRGFGADLVEEGLPYTFGGAAKLQYRPDGLECLMEFPLEAKHFVVAPEAVNCTICGTPSIVMRCGEL